MASHYFLERAISVAIYAFISMIFCNQISSSKTNVRKVLFFLTIILSALAYFFQPTESMDLHRLWITADDYNKYPLLEMTTKIFSGWTSPLGLVYVCGISKINHHLLPSLTAFLFYTNITYIVSDYWKKNEISNSSVALVLFLFLSRGVYGEVISGIRSMLAFSFVARCIYDETYNNKSFLWNIPIYIIVSLFHSAAMGAIAVWFVLKILFGQKGIKRIIYIPVLVLAVGVFYYFWGDVVTRNLDMGLARLGAGDSYFYIWEFVFNSLYMFISLLIWRTARFSSLTSEGKRMKYIVTSFYVVSIICISSYSIYHRFISFTTMFSLPVLIEIMNNCEQNDRVVPKKNLLILAVIMMVLSGLKGNLNGIRFFTF